MKNRSGREWTQAEIDLIMDQSENKTPDNIIADNLNRSLASIFAKRRRISNHGLDRKKYNQKYYNRHRKGKFNSLIKKRWTEREISMITALEQPNDVHLSRLLNRSVRAIQVKRSKLRQQELCSI